MEWTLQIITSKKHPTKDPNKTDPHKKRINNPTINQISNIIQHIFLISIQTWKTHKKLVQKNRQHLEILISVENVSMS